MALGRHTSINAIWHPVADAITTMHLSDSYLIYEDPIAIGAYHAVENGIMVVCSVGNNGPVSATVVNGVPWITTVAASTIDRHFDSDVELGNNIVIKGGSINVDNSPVSSLTYGGLAMGALSENAARNCQLGSIEGRLIKGKIVLFYNDDGHTAIRTAYIKEQGGSGILLVDDELKDDSSRYLGAYQFYVTAISSEDADVIISYIESIRNPTATILATITTLNYKPAPKVASFSSRGPTNISRNLLTPDISAPGKSILARKRLRCCTPRKRSSILQHDLRNLYSMPTYLGSGCKHQV